MEPVTTMLKAIPPFRNPLPNTPSTNFGASSLGLKLDHRLNPVQYFQQGYRRVLFHALWGM